MPLELGLAMDFGTSEGIARRMDETISLLDAAQRAGFVSIWAGEGRPSTEQSFHLPSPLVVLAGLSRSTSLALGTGVTLLSSWDTQTLAYDAAVLDAMSGGRLRLGVAAGHPPAWAARNITREEIAPTVDQMLQSLKASWSRADFFPRPAQPSGPPLLVGGIVRAAIDRAARLGDGWFAATNYRFDNEIAPAIDRYRAARAAHGRALGTVAVTRITVLAETDDAAWAEGGRYVENLVRTYGSYGALRRADGTFARAGDSDVVRDIIPQLALVGSPRTVRRELDRYEAAGVTHVQMRVRPADLPLAHVQRTIELVGSM